MKQETGRMEVFECIDVTCGALVIVWTREVDFAPFLCPVCGKELFELYSQRKLRGMAE